MQAWNAGERHVVDELAAPDLTVSYTHYPEPYHGPDAFKEMLAKTHHFFPDLPIVRCGTWSRIETRPSSAGRIGAPSRTEKCSE